jgi:PLP dependent protein
MSETQGGAYDEQALAARLGEVRARVWAALERAGRPRDAARIVAVTKKHPAEVIRQAMAAGVRDIGENYVQEMVAKMEALGLEQHDGDGDDQAALLRWHFIGQMQRNKVKHVVGRAALIHAVDSEPLAREIDDRAGRLGIVQPVLVAVNLGGEEQKSGVPPARVEGLLAVLAALAHVSCAGLMTMPPLAHTPEDSRPYFRALAELRAARATAERPLSELSMGTTDDFEIAIEEGATLVRVGTAIFGARPST